MRKRRSKRPQTKFNIIVTDLQKKLKPDPARVLNIIRAILNFLKVTNANLSVVFVTSRKIRQMNKKYLDRDYTTDVLAFDLSEEGETFLNGDIIISTDAAIVNAKRFQTDVARELSLYMIHGILHLLDYDDHSGADTRKMRKQEQTILDNLGLKAGRIL